jgi:DNA invertase Pin-like site-specific DNA recombinase
LIFEGKNVKKKIFGYIRVSGKGQVGGDGFPRQEKAIREYAKLNNLEIVQIFKEKGVSGTVADRPELAKLLISLEKNGHGIKTVIVENMTRLARDLMVQEAIVNDLKKQGFDLISVQDGSDLLSNDPTRKLVRQVLGAIAEYDKQMIVLKLRVARERKRVSEGKCEGRKSYKEINPHIIQEIKTLRRKPRGIKKKKTFNEIAEILNDRGNTTSSGKPFTAMNVHKILKRQG